MKPRFIALFLSLILCFMCGTPLYASEYASPNVPADIKLYEQYQALVDEVNAEYGYSLSLLPFDSMTTMYSYEDFKSILYDYCAFKEAVPVCKSSTFGNTREAGVFLVPCTIERTHSMGTVTVTFNGTFEVRQNLNGSYYIKSVTYATPSATSDNPLLYYTLNGSLSSTVIDGGRGRQVSQDFDVWLYNSISDTVTVSGFYYFNSSTGNITTGSV